MTAAAAVLAGLAVLALGRTGGPGRGRVARLQLPPLHRRSGPIALWSLPAGVLGLALGGPVLAALLVGLGLAAPRVLKVRDRGRRLARERARSLEALGLLAAELRAGRPPAAALAGAAEVAVDGARSVLEAAAAAARMGGDVPAALLQRGPAVPGTWAALATCWEVCTGFGHGLAAAVERLEEGLRAAEEQRRAVDAELAGPRATAGLLAALPVAGLALAAALGAHPLGVLLHTPAGLVCLLLGLVADLAGLLWTRALVTRALPL